MASNSIFSETDLKNAAVACVECGCVIPLNEAFVPEAQPYVVYFCGLDCYALWRARAALVVQTHLS